jgi:transposase InsO family protein
VGRARHAPVIANFRWRLLGPERRLPITCSMSRRGNVYDNAAMESWFSTLKSELGKRFETHGAAKEQLFDYIEVFYNQQRRHSVLGYLSPAEFERAAQAARSAA